MLSLRRCLRLTRFYLIHKRGKLMTSLERPLLNRGMLTQEEGELMGVGLIHLVEVFLTPGQAMAKIVRVLQTRLTCLSRFLVEGLETSFPRVLGEDRLFRWT